MVPSIQQTMAIVNCRNSPLRSSNFSWVGGVSLVQDPYFLTQNVWMKSVSPSALTVWRASLSCWNNGFPFLTAIDVPDIANGSPTTLSPHLLIDLYSRLTSSAINTSSFLCKYKNRNSSKVMNIQFNCSRLLMIFCQICGIGRRGLKVRPDHQAWNGRDLWLLVLSRSSFFINIFFMTSFFSLAFWSICCAEELSIRDICQTHPNFMLISKFELW